MHYSRQSRLLDPGVGGGGGRGTPYIRMIGMIVVFSRGCNRRFSIFRVVQAKSINNKKKTLVFVRV